MPDHARSDDPAVQAQLDRFAQLSPGRDVLGLERIAALLDAIGNPQRALPPVFHVAGTNGKGSTCAFLRAGLEAAGLTAHVYTSPHLCRFNERIRIAGTLIDDAALAPLLAKVLDAAEARGIAPSFFEATTAAAFLAFAGTPADAAIIEVGLGGRLDATNVIERPAACGIAQLGIDHEAFLLDPSNGPDWPPAERIGWEKAGIAKPGVPLVTMDYPQPVAARIAEHARVTGAAWLPRRTAWHSAIYEGALHYRDDAGRLALPLPRLRGGHQAENAALAVAMLRHQDAVAIPEAALKAAMGWAEWPARMQRLGAGPLTALLPEATTLWLDGGHNPAAAQAVLNVFPHGTRPHLIIGMLRNKDVAGFLGPLAPHISGLSAVPVPHHEHHDPKDICRLAQESLGIPNANPRGSVAEALTWAARDASRPADEPIIICGTLYLAGEVLRANGQVPE
jgi:dihydrofolate synthase/folylpolyglutamate synthase